MWNFFADPKKLDKGLQAASRKLKSWGDSVMKVGAAVWAAGTAIDAAFDATAMLFASTAGEAGKMSARTGIAVEAVTALAFAAERTGGSVEGLETSLLRMDRTITGAIGGQKEAADALRNLGLEADHLSRMTPDAAFKVLATAIAKIPNPMEQAARAQAVFGRGVLDLLPLLKRGGAGVEEFMQRARELHLTVSADDVKTAREFNGMMAELVASFKRVAYEVGKAALPALQALRGQVQPFVTKTIEWIQANRGLVVSITKIGLVIAGVGAGIIAIGGALYGLGAVVGVIGAIVGPLVSIVTFLGPIGTAIVALGGYLLYTSGVGGKALNWLGEQFGGLKQDAVDAWEGIVAAVKAGDLKAAWAVAVAFVRLEWAKGVNWLSERWNQFGDFIYIKSAEFFGGLTSIVNDVTLAVKNVWRAMVDFMADKLDLLATGAKLVWNGVAADAAVAWAKAKGVFEKGAELDAKVQQIRDQQKAANEDAARGMVERRGRREADSAAGAAEDQRRHDMVAAAVLAAERKVAEARRQLREAEAAGNREEEARLRKELDDAIAAAKNAKPPGGGGGGEAGGEKPFLGSVRAETAGTFAGLAASRLGGEGDSAQRTATNTALIAARILQLVRLAEQGGLVLG